MRRATLQERSDTWRRYLEFKWELIRRNPEYLKDYEQHKDRGLESFLYLYSKWGVNADPRKDEPGPISDSDVMELIGYIDNNKINILPNKAEKYKVETKKSKGDIPIIKVPGIVSAETLIFAISLNPPTRLVLMQLEEIFTSLKSGSNRKKKKIPWDMLDIYIKIFDLNNEGKSLEDIAREVYKSDFSKAERDGTMPSLIRKVSRNLSRSKEMVRSGKMM